MDSILTSVKKTLGIAEEYECFDADLIMHINSVFAILTQMGVGHVSSFRITGKEQKWTDFLKNDLTMEDVKTYVSLKVKYIFDPPSGGSASEAMTRMISELEWRLFIASDPIGHDGSDDKCYDVDWGDSDVDPDKDVVIGNDECFIIDWGDS